MKNDVKSSNEQREQALDSISKEINDMFAYQELDYRDVVYIREFEDVGMRIIGYDLE